MARRSENSAPTIEYLFSSPHGDVIVSPSDLAAFIPLSLSDVRGGSRSSRDGLTYAQYFEILKTYLSDNSYHALLNAYGKKTGTRISSENIEAIRIRSEKHGDFYHISSIDLLTKDGPCKFALTTALSGSGKSCLSQDCSWINFLNSKYRFSYLPRVYSKDQLVFPVLQEPEHPVLFVLGDWLEEYHEFHLSIGPSPETQRMILWDTKKGYKYLSPSQTFILWQQIAKILTLYYDFNTFDEICAWHHAAGDFVASRSDDRIDVRLITVRCYAPMIGFSEVEESNKIAALLHFFAHLSLRMRLDRIDGIGKPAWWADASCPTAVVQGFRDAMDTGNGTEGLPSAVKKDFYAIFEALGENDWLEILTAASKTYPQADADLPLIEANLTSHARELHSAIQSYNPPESAQDL